MSVEQFEALRLMDREGLTQDQCAAQMGVARTTVQRIYAEARSIVAEALVEGLPLQIEGGDYLLSSHHPSSESCGPHCRRRGTRNRGGRS